MSFFKRHTFIMGILLLVVVLVTAIGYHVVKRSHQKTEVTNEVMGVSVVSAREFLQNQGFIGANGTVESLEQAELRSQVSAPVTAIRVAIGSKVTKGQELVVLQNNDIAAQLAQAQAAVKAQEARLDELKKGMRTEEYNVLEAKLNAAKQSYEDTKKQQDIAVANAYNSLLNSGLTAKPSQVNNPAFVATISGTYSGTQEGSYSINLYATGQGWKFQYAGLESGTGQVSTVAQPLGTRGLYIKFSDTTVTQPNSSWTVSIPNTESPTYSASLNGYTSAQQGRDSAVNAAQNAYEGVKKEFDLKQAGASNEQIKSQEAMVDQARANVALVAAQISKTIIRSPINGTVSVLPVKYGELVGMGQSVVSIVNKGGLQIKAYLSDTDLPLIEEGADVTINGTVAGKVVRLSPSINSATKTVEVNVLVVDPETSGLIVGQNAAIQIATKQGGTATGQMFIVPLQAVRVSANDAFVFTAENDKVTEHRVVLGKVLGEQVEIVSGMDPEMKIVSTAYELKNGQQVKIK